MRHLARLLFVLALAGRAGSAGAQEPDRGAQLADRAPRFLVASTPSAPPAVVDASSIPALRRRISLDLDGVTLEEALTTVSRQAGLRLMYSKAIVPLGSRVRLQAKGITVAGALMELLLDAKVDVLLAANGQAVLMKRGEAGVKAAVVQGGTVVGRVTDVKTGEALGGAEVWLEGTRWRASTAVDGRYRLMDVTPGSYTIAVRRLGYAKQSRAVALATGAEVTIDVALQPVATQLNEIVTTVTGEQRLRELGHVVGRINVDSLVKEAPVASVSELLNGRVPGLQVFTNSGQVGGKVSLQVRTMNSITLGTEPIVFVDGIRYASGTSGGSGPFGVEQTSRLNDLNPNDIESIEVVKGPSAATLYGTDAANGVLVVTTKRGRPGPVQWNTYARASVSEIPLQRYPPTWWGWNDDFGEYSSQASCTLEYQASGWCTQDSVTVLPSPLDDPRLTILGSKPSWEYGANVSGGRQDIRYYFSGDLQRAIGPIQMPKDARERLKTQRGVLELRDEVLKPNAFTKTNLRATVTASLGRVTELHLNTGYARNATRTLSLDGPYASGVTSTPADPYNGGGLTPEQQFALTSTERVDRFFGSATGQWRPAAWFQARGTLGLDLASSNRYSLARVGEAPDITSYSTGTAGDDRTRQLGITADLGLTALVRHGRISVRTAVGAQYVRSLTDALSSTGTGLPPGGESVGQAATRNVRQSYSETVTLGSYLEETLGLNDRLFLTGALRVDGASAFGRDYDAAVYPKASVSWLLSQEPFLPRLPGLDELRLRYAFGASGQQAISGMALPTFTVRQATLDGAASNTIFASSLGNPALRPERVREHEIGFDASGLDGRVRLGLTWFKRTTIDQILNRPLPLGFGNIFSNLGRATGRGFEAEFTIRPVDTRSLSWQVSLQHALRRSLLVDLGGVSSVLSYNGSWVEGYPIGARFARPITGYADANGDGVLVPTEVQSGELTYRGESTPPRSQTLTTMVGLFQQRLRLSAMFERRSGFTQVNQLRWSQCASSLCRAAVDPSTPLAEQAEAIAMRSNPPIEPGDFTRFREIAITLEVPAGVLRVVRLHSATCSVAARNLALWTSFDGPDPESAAVRGFRGDVARGIPQSRMWIFRLDLGL